MMPLYWIDGFELYDIGSVNLLRAYQQLGGTQGVWAGEYRTGAQGLWCYGNNIGVKKVFSSSTETTMTLGFTVKLSAMSDVTGVLCNLYSQLGNLQIQFAYNTNGTVYAYQGGTLGTTGVILSTSAYNYIEIKVYLHDSAGTVEIHYNGVEELSLTSQDTKGHADAYIGGFDLLGINVNKYAYYDDVYFNTDFLGDCRVDVLRVSGGGSNTDFASSAGVNYENVDESPGPDDDTTYNDGDALNEKDTYALNDMSPGGTIFGVKHQMTVKKTDAGTVKVKPVIRSGGADHVGDEVSLSTDYTTETHVWENNPDDSNPWEEADINGAEAGIQITDYP